MSTEDASTRKRKPTEELEAVVSSDDVQIKSKTRRVSMDAFAFTKTKPMIAETTSDSEQSESAFNAQQDESMVSIGALVQEFFILTMPRSMLLLPP